MDNEVEVSPKSRRSTPVRDFFSWVTLISGGTGFFRQVLVTLTLFFVPSNRPGSGVPSWDDWFTSTLWTAGGTLIITLFLSMIAWGSSKRQLEVLGLVLAVVILPMGLLLLRLIGWSCGFDP